MGDNGDADTYSADSNFDSSYTADQYSLDDFASNCAGLSSIVEEEVVESCSGDQSKHESKLNDSYSYEDDFVLSSSAIDDEAELATGHRRGDEAASLQQREKVVSDELTCDGYSMDDNFACTSSSTDSMPQRQVEASAEISVKTGLSPPPPIDARHADMSSREEECKYYSVEYDEHDECKQYLVGYCRSIASAEACKQGCSTRVEDSGDSQSRGGEVTAPATDEYTFIGNVEMNVSAKKIPQPESAAADAADDAAADADADADADAAADAAAVEDETTIKRCQDAETQTGQAKDSSQCVGKPQLTAKKRKPAPLVPRCAYALTKAMEMRKDQLQTVQEKPKVVHRYSKKRLEQLARPVKHRVYQRIEDIPPDRDAQEKGQNRSKKKSICAGDVENFLDRMNVMEMERQQKLERASAEAAYSARPDIKKCSLCGAAQSYDEMIRGKTNCQSDRCKKGKKGGHFQSSSKFEIKAFEQRMARSARRRSLILEGIEEERRLSQLGSRRCSRRQKELRDKVSTDGDFNVRMANDIIARKKKGKSLASLEQLGKEYTFAPQLNIREDLVRHRRGGWDFLSKPLRRYTEEYQPPEESPQRKKVQRRRRKKPIETPWQSSRPKKKAVDEGKMKKRFQQMIM